MVSKTGATDRSTTFESWAADADVRNGGKPFKGWPITIRQWDNDGRKVLGEFGEITVEGVENPVLQVVSEDSGELLYTYRVQGNRFTPRVYTQGSYTVNIGRQKPDGKSRSEVRIVEIKLYWVKEVWYDSRFLKSGEW